MSRVIVFGGDGLLGSHLYLALKNAHHLCLTLHSETPQYPKRLFASAQVITGVAAGDKARVASVLDTYRPDWVINAIGLTKRPLASDPYASLEANSLFPHLLAGLCAERATRMIHFSTDGVFSGRRGAYSESDCPDGKDWYGRCKLLGEPAGPHVLVLRTAFVGLEISCKLNLVEWFLAQRGHVKGFRKAVWSGFTAAEVARLVAALVEGDVGLGGIWHVASQPISKYDLLSALASRLDLKNVAVIPDDRFVCDRSLDGSAFSARAGYVAPSWESMIDELAQDVRRRWRADAPSYW